MRELGYPPGWLLHAEATNSGLAMFDKLGKEVDLDGDIMEDGQVPDHRMRDEANRMFVRQCIVLYMYQLNIVLYMCQLTIVLYMY